RNLTAQTQVPGSGYTNPNSNGCSYSGSATETVTIQNAVPGQFYILLITNYSQQTQTITFQQVNANNPGAASTNCGVICGITASNSGSICSGKSATLSVTTGTAVTSFTWVGPNGPISNNYFQIVPNLTATTVFTVLG